VFLHFLKKHNPYYADIVICPSDLVDLPADGDISDRLPHVETSSAPTGSDSNTADQPTAPASEDLPALQPDCLSEEENMFVPHFFPGTYEIDAIREGMAEVGLNTVEEHAIPWPIFKPALSEYTTDGLFAMSFPSLFPLGKADWSDPRRVEFRTGHPWDLLGNPHPTHT
jgi:hypothetical protein